MSTPDPTPTPLPAAPDWRALCQELRAIIPTHGTGNPSSLVVARVDAALATPPVAPGTIREQMKAAIADALGGGAYDCLRVWSAWGIGTMGEDDFSSIADDDDRVAEIADAAIAALSTPPAVDGDERLRLVTAGIYSGYIAGHDATVEGHYGDPDEVAADMAPMVLAEVGAAPPAAPLEPRGCPTPGACSCPTAPIVPPELLRALELAEAALADISDAEREPGDDIAWAERRAAQNLPRIRHALRTWRDHATPPAATREAGPLPAGAKISDEELAEVASAVGLAWETWEDELLTFARAVWNRAVLARWGGAAVPVSERPWEQPGWCDGEGRCWCFAVGRNWRSGYSADRAWMLRQPEPGVYDTHSLPHWALPVPAAAVREVQP